MPDKDITLRQEELRIQKEMLSTNKELLKIQQRKGALNEGDVRIQRSISNVLQDQVKYDKYSVNERRKINQLSKKLVDLSEKVYTFDVKGLGTTTKSEKIQKQILQTQQNIRILGLQRNKIGEKGSKLQKEINDNINLQIALTKKVTAELIRQEEAAKEIENNKIANNFGNLSNLLAKIPLLSSLAPAFKEGSEAAREMGSEITLFGKGMMSASEYTGENLAKFGKNARVEFTHTQDSVDELQQKAARAQAKLDKGVKDPAKAAKLGKIVQKGGITKVGDKENLFGAAAKSALTKGTADLKGVNKEMLLLKAAWKAMGPLIAKLAAVFLFDALMKADKMLTDIRRNLGVSQGEAYKLNLTFNKMANNADSLRVNLASIRVASEALNNAYGTAVMFNEKTLQTSAEILDAKLMDAEATANLNMMANIHGKSLESALISQQDAVNAVNKEHKTRINLKGVLNEANKITGQISAQLGGDPKRIAAAVTQAKALGMEFKDIAASSKQLLDFESSIENELTAELMLGKSLNLEKARLAALTGDYSTFMDEINSQVGDFGDFMNMNVLQQDALAASVGMTSDQLSTQLMKKANLVELEKEARDAGKEQLADSYMQLNNTEKFNLAVQKVKDAFVSLMAVVQPIADVIGLMIDGFRVLAPAIKLATAAMGVYLLVTKGAAIWAGITAAFTSAGKIPYVGWFVAAGLALATAGMVSRAAKKTGDLKSPAEGKTEVSTKEGGLFELSKNDDLAAGPGILDKLKEGGGIINLKPLASAFDMLSSSISVLSTTVSNKFDTSINTMTEKFDALIGKQPEGDLSKTLIDTQDKHSSMLTKLAIGVAAAAMPFGLGAPLAMATGLSVLTDQYKSPGIENVPAQQEETLSPMGDENSIAVLEKKLDEIKSVLQQEKNINVNVNNKLKYDSFSDNNIAYVNGKESVKRTNNSSFI